MAKEGIFINYDNLIRLAYQLKIKIKEIEGCYISISGGTRDVDGTTEYWQGESQKDFYDSILLVTGKYQSNLKKLYEIYTFLCGIIDSYEKNEKELSAAIEKNIQNLGMDKS